MAAKVDAGAPLAVMVMGAAVVVGLGVGVLGSLKPRAVIGSVGDSWMVLGLGREVRDVDGERTYWSRLRYSRTVPSPRPMARWESVSERAMEDTYGQEGTSLTDRKIYGVVGDIPGGGDC